MRTGVAFYAADASSGMGQALPAPPSATPAGGGPHSAWHSPVPYLFGGLAAMLSLIALALLILACSYWKVSGYLGSVEADATDDQDKPGDSAAEKNPALLEERFLVIMPGDSAPSVLAVPIAIRPPPAVPSPTSNSNDSTSSSTAMQQGGELSPPDEGNQDH